MTEDLNRLRRKVEQGWAHMDSRVAAGPTAAASSNDDDYLVEDEGSEMEKLSKQLNMQTDMNNGLLQQVIQLETEKQQMQREMDDKQVAQRKTLAVCDQLKQDLQDIKRKNTALLAEQKQYQQQLSQNSVELGLKQREVDDLRAVAAETNLLVQDLEREREELRRDVERSKREEQKWRAELDLLREEEAVRDAERRADVDTAQREAQTFKTRMSPLEAELRAEQKRAEELQALVLARNQELKQAQAQLAEVKTQFQHFKEKADRALVSEEDLTEQLAQRTRQCQQYEQQVAAAGELVSASEQELVDVKRQLAESNAARRELETEAVDMAQQMDALAQDLKLQSQARKADRERLEQRVSQLQAELDAATHDARSIGKSLSEDAAKRELEHADQRRKLEDAKAKLQNEVARLNDALLGVQRELQNVRAEVEDERTAYEERIADATRKLRAMEQEVARTDLLVAEEANKWQEKLLQANAALNARTRLHAETLGALESTLQGLAQECARLEASEEDLVDQVDALREALREYANDGGSAMLQEWSTESKRSMIALADLCEGAEQEARDAREHQLLAESQLDEEKTRTLVLEEERHRMEEEIKALEERLRSTDTHASDRVRALQREADLAIQARAEMELDAKRTQDQLERANAQTRTMQQDLERTRLAGVETQQKLRDRVAALEDKLANNTALVNEATAGRDQAQAELAMARKQVEAQQVEINALRQDLQRVEEAASRDSGETTQVKELSKQLDMLKTNMRKQSVQFTQTQKLLQVLQDQRRDWLEEKQRLVLELENERGRGSHTLQLGMEDGDDEEI